MYSSLNMEFPKKKKIVQIVNIREDSLHADSIIFCDASHTQVSFK